MDHRANLSSALDSLTRAVASLESSAARHNSRAELTGNAETELMLMREDRARLAAELDEALARAAKLEQLQSEASLQLDQAIASVRSLLDEAAETPPSE